MLLSSRQRQKLTDIAHDLEQSTELIKKSKDRGLAGIIHSDESGKAFSNLDVEWVGIREASVVLNRYFDLHDDKLPNCAKDVLAVEHQVQVFLHFRRVTVCACE